MDKNKFYSKLGDKIKEIREERGYSLADVASYFDTKKEISLNKGSLSMIEKGGRPVSAYLLFCLAEFLNAPIQNFFTIESDVNHLKDSDDIEKIKNI